jgi:Na+-driven multidrug efflux pump
LVLIILTALIYMFTDPLIGLVHLSAEAHGLAKSYILVYCIAAPVFWPLGFTLPNALRAAGDARYCMMVSIITMWIVRVSAAYLIAYPLGFGSVGAWIAMGLDFAARAGFYTTRWVRGKWQEKRVLAD